MAAEKQNLQSTQTIAKLFGVTTRMIEYLKTEGIIQGQGKPIKYDLYPTIQAYIQYLKEKANGKIKPGDDQQNESAKLEGEARIKQAKAEMAELQLKELRGEMHRAEDVQAVMTDHVLMIRSILMGLPNKLAVSVTGARSTAEAAEIIKKEVYFILHELSNYEYDAEEYKKRVRERNKWLTGEFLEDGEKQAVN